MSDGVSPVAPSRVGGLARLAGLATGAAFAGLATVRRGKPVHPHGIVFEAKLRCGARDEPLAEAELFDVAERRAVVRFSRSLGVPRPIPDLLGMSLRIPHAYGEGRHQDFLLVTSIDAPLLHHLLVPARDVQQRPYSSSFPYRLNGRSVVIGALPRGKVSRRAGKDELERAVAAARTGDLVFDLAVAELWGRFRPVAELSIGAPMESAADALRFNPWNTGGGLEPAGILNALRGFAYPRSQRAWARAGLADAQRLADRIANEHASGRRPT